MNFASSTPPPEPMLNATTPIIRIASVCKFRNAPAVVVAPTEMPRKMVQIFINSFCTVLLRRSVTPLSRNRLPNIRQPMSGAADGNRKDTNAVTTMGKTIFSCLDTFRSCFMTISRSFRVVRARMMGGWMTGTSAM